MLSPKFIQLIESHSDQIVGEVLRQIRRDPKTTYIATLPKSELESQFAEIVRNLGHWLTESPETELARRFGNHGRLRRQEGVPIHESVRALQLLKEAMLDHIRNQGVADTSVDLYAEEELEHQIGLLFDHVIYHVVRGAEVPLPRAARTGS